MEYIPLVLACLGVVLIIVGVIVSIIDWNQKHPPEPKKEGVVTEKTGLEESISALAKLAEALKNLTLGMQLIFAGMVLEIIAAFFGGIVALAGK
jgi:hypothetical protein